MALEPFLINPVRRRRRRASVRTRRKSGLPSALLRRMMKTYGRKRGMKEAWAEYRRGVRKNAWPGATLGHRRASGVGWSRRIHRKRGMAKPFGAHYPRWRNPIENPLGEEVIVVSNPRRRRRVSRRRRYRAYMFDNDPGRRTYRRRRRRRVRLFDNPRRRRRSYRRRRTYMFDNPRRRRRSYRRRYRRNPAIAPALSLRRPMTLVMPVLTGVVAKLATERVPTMLNVTAPLTRAAVQLGVAFGGGMILRRMIGSVNAGVWTIVSAVTIASELVNRYVFKTALSYMSAEEIPYGGFPVARYGSGMSAYPEQMSDDMGAFPTASYPY